MWPFSRKPKDLSALPGFFDPSHEWGVAHGDYGGAPMLVRYCGSAGDWAGHPGLPIKLGFAIPMNDPRENDLPSAEENEQLSDVEDQVLREVASRATGIYVLALTTGTMKEFVFYIAPGADIPRMHKTLRDAVTTHEVQCMANHEPKWDTFRDFSPG